MCESTERAWKLSSGVDAKRPRASCRTSFLCSAIPDTAKDGTAVTIDGGLVASWIEGKGVKCFDGGSSNFATCSVEGSSKGATALLITLTGGK